MGFLAMKLWEGVASAFRLSLASFRYFVKTSIFFHHLNQNDDPKESESGVGVGVGATGILGVGVGVGVGILGKLGVGVGVGPYTFRLRNPAQKRLSPSGTERARHIRPGERK